MIPEIDQSVYPDLDQPPAVLETPEAKADYVDRICGAWDFGVYPEQATFDLFAQWRDIFDKFPIITSPGLPRLSRLVSVARPGDSAGTSRAHAALGSPGPPGGSAG